MHKLSCINVNSMSLVIELFLNLILLCFSLGLELVFYCENLVSLLVLKLCNFLLLFFLLSHSNLDSVLLLNRLHSSEFGFGMFFKELFNCFIFLVLQHFEVFSNFIHNSLGFWIHFNALHL